MVDGDTVDLTIDAGFHNFHVERVRLFGVNAPEMSGLTKEAGAVAKDWVEGWFDKHPQLVIQTYKTDAFGRYLAEIWADSGEHLNEDLIAAGHAQVRL